MAGRTPNSELRTPNSNRLVTALLEWFAASARDLPWRRTHDPYAIWVSEIMLQQTQVKTVIPFWERWLRELPTIEAAANASQAKLHKLWEGLGYYTRVRNLQKAAQAIVAQHKGVFPEKFDDVLALPGIGRYTAGAICSIAFNQPRPILDGNVIRVLTRVFGVAENPKEKETNKKLWQLAEELVFHALAAPKHGAGGSRITHHAVTPRCSRREEAPISKTKNSQSLLTSAPASENCSALNQSLMELGALVCTPRTPQCLVCPVQKLCVAFREGRTEELPNLGKRAPATARRFMAFVVEHNGKFLVRQRPAGVVNAHLWEFPNVEVNDGKQPVEQVFESNFGFATAGISPLVTVKHSITRYRITMNAFRVNIDGEAVKTGAVWKTPAQMRMLAFAAAHKKLASAAVKSIMSDR